jgi:hypothetical protein
MNSSLLNYFRFSTLDGVSARWAAIDQYNAGIRDRLPPGANEFVSSDWHYNYGDPRCPHDSWIKSIDLKFAKSGKQTRDVQLCLLGAYHDRDIYFDYTDVTYLSIDGQLVAPTGRNLDWIYDEVHLCDSGLIEHIIEFGSSMIRIECVDFRYSFVSLTE